MSEQGTGVDVARLMEEIKERVRQRKASGFYSEEEVRRITQMELELTEIQPEIRTGFRGEVEERLAAANEAWDVLRAPAITSHRRLLGPLIVAAKRLLFRLAQPYTRLALARQVEFNTALLHLLNAFVLPVRDQLGALAHRAEEVLRRLNEVSLELHERVAATHGEALRGQRELGQRLEALAREVAGLQAAVARLRAPAAVELPPPPALPPEAGGLPAHAYLAFEDRHRGTREAIRERQRQYLACFPAGPILDVGCGRGEFLELCREAGLEARGIDRDPAMVAVCREAGLAAEQADAFAYLAGLPDGALGGVFCAQVIEHLAPEAFLALVRLFHAKLRPGGVAVLETPNPACLSVFASAFYVDLTHVKPIHPEAAVFVLETVGFTDVQVRFVNPCPPDARLAPIPRQWYMRRYEEVFIDAINDNLQRLNDLLWGAQDYAVIGRKP